LAGVVAVAAAAAFVGDAAPAAAFGFHGGFRSHRGFGGFHHGFGPRFAFGGFGSFPGYAYGDYAAYGCLRRVWGPYGWRFVDVCQ
jgi:hypothetical protein